MSVYFVYRCPYIAPAGKHLKRFDDDTVLDWFRNRWHLLASYDDRDASKRLEREMGYHICGFFYLYDDNAQESLPLPETLQAVVPHLNAEDVLFDSPHVLQVCTRDEVGLAYYFFDDHFLKRHGKRAVFLLADTQLPGSHGPGGFRASEPTAKARPRGPWQGTIYLVELDGPADMDDLCEAMRIEGVRLPGLARYLMRFTLEAGDCPLPLLLAPRDDRHRAGRLRSPGKLVPALPPRAARRRGHLERLLRLASRARRALRRRSSPSPCSCPPRPRRGRLVDQATESGQEVPRDRDRCRGHCHGLRDLAPPRAHAADRQAETSRSLVFADEHIAQLCLHDHYWAAGKCHHYHHWILFDDLWASAHPDLANALLRYVRRWDVLSPARSKRSSED